MDRGFTFIKNIVKTFGLLRIDTKKRVGIAVFLVGIEVLDQQIKFFIKGGLGTLRNQNLVGGFQVFTALQQQYRLVLYLLLPLLRIDKQRIWGIL